jgi:hypothetical protein
MATYRLFVAALSDEVMATDLHAVFSTWGEVRRTEPFMGTRIGPPAGKVWVELETDQTLLDILDALNGYQIGEQRLVVTPDKVIARKQQPRLPDDQWAVCKQIARTLGEKEPRPLLSIADIVRTCGPRFALVMSEQALAVEAAGGLMLPDGSRRRTPGGVFFYLVRRYASPPVSKMVFFRGGKPKKGKTPVAKPLAAPAVEFEPEPVAPPDPLAEAREHLEELRQLHRAAQQNLEALQTSQKQGGLFTAVKQVLEVQRQIDALLTQYPDLS